MKRKLCSVSSVAAILGLLVSSSSLIAATGEVTLSGSTWTGRVDGVTRYTGSDKASAVNACVGGMSSGTINVRNSGSTNNPCNVKTNVVLDGTGTTFSGGGTLGIVYAANASNTGGRNINMSSSNWYGIYFRTCQGINATNNNGTANLSFRIDNCKGGTGSNLSIASTTSDNTSSHGSHHVETYGINGITFSTITSFDRTGGNGCLLNFSSNTTGTTNNATRACVGCGYAGFRTANTNGKTVLGSVVSTSCGRGYFSVSGSRDCTISTVDIRNSSSHGIWLQTTYNTRINGGWVQSSNPCTVITAGSGNVILATCGTPPAFDTYQAESATLGGGSFVETTNTGYRGSGYINSPTTGGTITFSNIDGNGGGSKVLGIRYANGSGASRTGQLVINGVATNITFGTTANWTTWAVHNVTVTLNSGAVNSIGLNTTGGDLANIDEITVP